MGRVGWGGRAGGILIWRSTFEGAMWAQFLYAYSHHLEEGLGMSGMYGRRHGVYQ